HQAKGLEFKVVFLSGFAQGLFPLAARPHPLLDEEDQSWLEHSLHGFRPSWPSNPQEHAAEEGRLGYVGITRARQRLYVTYAHHYDARAGPPPSRDPAFGGVQRPGRTRSKARLNADSVLTLAEAETVLAGAKLAETSRARLAALGVDLGFITDPNAGRPFEPYRTRPEEV